MPLAVARITDHSVPMITTNSMAPSVWPNHRVASGTQHTLGSAWNPRETRPRVFCMSWKREHSMPRGIPITRPIPYPITSLFTVIHEASSRDPSRKEEHKYSHTSSGEGNK